MDIILSTKKEHNDKFKSMIAKAKARLAEQNKLCPGCFAPRNNIIVKPHLETVIWKYKDIQISSERSLVIVPCMFCKNHRELPLSTVSMNFLKQDYDKYDLFALMKEGKYNRLIGVGDQKLGVSEV